MTIRRSTGLVDKLNGIRTNMILNGGFTSDTASWTATGATLASVAGGQVGNGLTITNSAAAAGTAHQDLTTIIGQGYRVTGFHRLGTGAAGGRVSVGTTAAPTSLVNSPPMTADVWTSWEFMFVASATTTRITLANISAVNAETTRFDEISVDEVYDGFVDIMRNCRINIYSSPQPATADAAATGTLLAVVTLNKTATGLTLNQSANGVASKPAADRWVGDILATGTAGWFRVYEFGDNPANTSTTNARFDGAIGTTGTPMIVGSTSLTAGLEFDITAFSYTAPRS